MKESDLDGLRARLDEHHDWPSEYMFKFIAPNTPDHIDAIIGVFPKQVRIDRRLSGGGKYISLTIHEVVANADAVFDRYREVNSIGGIFAM